MSEAKIKRSKSKNGSIFYDQSKPFVGGADEFYTSQPIKNERKIP
jgi:hypothetical protein